VGQQEVGERSEQGTELHSQLYIRLILEILEMPEKFESK